MNESINKSVVWWQLTWLGSWRWLDSSQEWMCSLWISGDRLMKKY